MQKVFFLFDRLTILLIVRDTSQLTFVQKILHHSKQLKRILTNIKMNNNIYGYGASTKGNVLLQLSKIDNKIINKIFEINKEKFNKFTPISKIKIINESQIKRKKPDNILLLIWHFGRFVTNKICPPLPPLEYAPNPSAPGNATICDCE